ncbi:transposase [Pseudomaricurvus alkylphenolicus]|uniref:transposase n=1 Tax=Pseudomaricurvus alkylphenolicus TaxID=1306991 RepID=UPI00141DCA7D|nr:transposase [Pseudomaricurvus alkylphenolicus]NIB45218.1 transposase [Pseudomaricurvus alkylphenolicus]
MSNQRYSPEFKDEAVRQVQENGLSIDEVSARLGVSAHSLYKWVKRVKPEKSDEDKSELLEAKGKILKLRAQLRRTEEERDPLKKPWRTMQATPSKVRLYSRTSRQPVST